MKRENVVDKSRRNRYHRLDFPLTMTTRAIFVPLGDSPIFTFLVYLKGHLQCFKKTKQNTTLKIILQKCQRNVTYFLDNR